MAQKSVETDLFMKTIGPMGKWQLVLISLIFPCKVPIAWHQMAIIFLAPPVEFVCVDHISDNDSIVFDSVCHTDCSGYVFDKSVFTETIVTQWSLICERQWLKDFNQMVFMGGIFVGSLLFGHLADRYGRRHPFLAAVVIQLISGMVGVISVNYSFFTFFRFLQAVATGGTMICSFVIIMEMTGSQYRDIVGILYHVPFTLGLLTLPIISNYQRHWSNLQLWISAPSFLFLGYYFILPESARWLITVGRNAEAQKIMEKFCKINGLPWQDMATTVRKISDSMTVSANANRKTSLVDLFRIRHLRVKTMCISFNWLVVSFCFYGVSQYIGQYEGNIFYIAATSAAVQVVATFITLYIMVKTTRKKTLVSGSCVGGIAYLILTFVPMGMVRLLLSIIGVMCFSCVFASIYVYTGELFPTVVRNIGLGFSSTMARVGSMAAPFVASLSSIQTWLPTLIFGLTPLIGSCLFWFLPETKGLKLPDTLDDEF